MIALFVSLAVASPVDCEALVANTVGAARAIAPADVEVAAVLAEFQAEQADACAKGWVPAASVRACIAAARGPEDVFACDEDLYDDLVGLWAVAGRTAVAAR